MSHAASPSRWAAFTDCELNVIDLNGDRRAKAALGRVSRGLKRADPTYRRRADRALARSLRNSPPTGGYR